MNSKAAILIVEDDAAVRNLMTVTMETQGYQYRLAGTGNEALIELTTHRPDIMLLDLGLPDMEGVDIIRKVRSWSAMPVIVISARSEDADKVEALDAGADDYLTKPFSVDELRHACGWRCAGCTRLRAQEEKAPFMKTETCASITRQDALT